MRGMVHLRLRWPLVGAWIAWSVLTAGGLGGCSHLPQADEVPVAVRLVSLGKPDVLLLGEQHDAASHHAAHRDAVQALTASGELAAVVLEMADAGHDTRHLPRSASEADVQRALAWRDSAWPWTAYGPAVMAAVAHGVPVLGGNLPNRENPTVMRDPQWDLRVPASTLDAQRQAVRDGHCNLLPAGQIGPMARIQVARDASLAAAVAAAARPGQTVLVLTGSAHANRRLGVPLHLPARLTLRSVRLAAGGAQPGDDQAFDAVWPTAPAPARDHCAELQEQLQLRR